MFDFDSKISGIPCNIQVIEYIDESPSHDCAGDFSFQFNVYDRKGYRAKWLEAKVTETERERILNEFLEIVAVGD